jgi:pantoate--beta-alanine ligase
MNVILKRAVADLERGGEIAAIEHAAKLALDEAGFDPIDYVAVRDAEDLSALGARVDRPARILAAAWLGATRLIDNFPVLKRPAPGNDA